MTATFLNGKPMFSSPRRRSRAQEMREKAFDGSSLWLTRRLLESTDSVQSPYTQNSWAYAGIKTKADMVDSVPLRILAGKRIDADATATPVRGDDPLARLLQRPSPLFTGSDLKKGISIYLDLYGEAFVIVYGRDGAPKPGEIPSELFLVNPLSMMPEIHASGIVLGWKGVGKDQRDVAFSASQVCHVKEFNPASIYRGQSCLAPVMGAMNYQLRANQFNNSLLANGADPGGVITSEAEIGAADAVALRSQWEDRHQGAMKGSRISILSGGLKYQPINATAKDMAFEVALKAGKQEILACLGLTPFDVGEVEATNYASAAVAQRMTWTKTILPRLLLIESALWQTVFEPVSRRLGRDVWAQFDLSTVEALQASITDKVTQAATLISAGFDRGAVNERLGLGIEEPEYIDTETPEAASAPVPPAQPAPPAKVAPPTKGITSKAWKATTRQDSKLEVLYRTALRKMFREIRADELAAIEKHATELNAALAAANPTETQETTSKAAGQSKTDSRAARPFSWPRAFSAWMKAAPDRWEARAREFLETITPDASKIALTEISRQMGGFNVVNPADQRWIDEAAKRTGSLIRVARNTAKRFNIVILNKIGQDGIADVAGLAKQVQATMGEHIVSSASTIARTETGFLQESIKVTAAKAEGYTHHKWVNASDARDSHQNQGSVKIGEKFPNGLTHPCEIGGPPEEVINCRCTTAPYIEESALGDQSDVDRLLARMTNDN